MRTPPVNPDCRFLKLGGYACNLAHPRVEQLCKSCQRVVKRSKEWLP